VLDQGNTFSANVFCVFAQVVYPNKDCYITAGYTLQRIIISCTHLTPGGMDLEVIHGL
jgi:hypothetical protein